MLLAQPFLAIVSLIKNAVVTAEGWIRKKRFCYSYLTNEDPLTFVTDRDIQCSAITRTMLSDELRVRNKGEAFVKETAQYKHTRS